MPRVLVSGSLAYDRIMDFPGLFAAHFVPEKLHTLSLSFQVDTFVENFGGTAGNIAYNLSLLGVEPVILATAGKDFEAYRKYLETNHIRSESIHVVQDDITSSAYIVTDKANNQIAAFYPGVGRVAYGDVQTEGVALAVVAAGCDEDMKALPRLYRTRGVKYVYDPGQHVTALTGTELLDAISGASVLFANDYELGLIVFKTGLNEAQLLERVPLIVATLGERGARLIQKGSDTTVAAVHKDNVVDPTGAGDAHRAGYVRGLIAGLDPKQCARLGATVAAYAVESYGTQNHRFTIEALKARYEKAYAEKLSL